MTTVRHIVHKDKWYLTKNANERAVRAALGYGVERAMVYVAVLTGDLRRSIKVISPTAFGSELRYATYQEGITPTYTKITPFLRPAAKDVAEKMPEFYKAAFKGAI